MNDLTVITHKDQRVLLTAQLAESMGTDSAVISNNFKRNENHYAKGKHFFCLEGEELRTFKATIHQNDDSLLRVNKLYLWTEKGAWMHAKSLNTDQAWGAYEMLVDDYYRVKEQKPKSHLEITREMLDQLITQEQRLTAMENRTSAIEQKVNNTTELLALNPTEWRRKVTNILNKIAQVRGGHDAYQDVRVESYQLLEDRAKCNLSIRLTNRKQKMALEGTSKSKIDKVNKMDVIADDARLVEIYLAVVKEMAIKYQVSLGAEDKSSNRTEEHDHVLSEI